MASDPFACPTCGNMDCSCTVDGILADQAEGAREAAIEDVLRPLRVLLEQVEDGAVNVELAQKIAGSLLRGQTTCGEPSVLPHRMVINQAVRKTWQDAHPDVPLEQS